MGAEITCGAVMETTSSAAGAGSPPPAEPGEIGAEPEDGTAEPGGGTAEPSDGVEPEEAGVASVGEVVSAGTTPSGWARARGLLVNSAAARDRAVNRAASATQTGKFRPSRRAAPRASGGPRRSRTALLYWATMPCPFRLGSLVTVPSWRARLVRTVATQSRPRCASRLGGAALVAIGLGISGCHLDSNFNDLGEKLLNPDVAGLDAPGKRWVSGAHFDLSVQADESGARYALARNENSELTVIDFVHGTHCGAGTVARYGNVASAPGQTTLIPVLVTNDDGSSSLGFSDFSCNRSSFQVATASLPLDELDQLPWGSGTALLIATADQGLALVDPWSEQVRPIAASVRSTDPVSAFNHYLWVDGGVIVVSDATLTPLAHFGENVSELAISPQDGSLAYVQDAPSSGAGGDLYRVDATGQHAPQQVASDACSVRYLALGDARKLSYLSPCGDRRLTFLDLSDGSTRVLADQVVGAPLVHTSGNDAFVTYVTTPAGSDSSLGTLWLVRGSDAPVSIADNARANPSAVTADGGLLSVLDWSNTGGRLVEWNGGTLTDHIATQVVELGSVGQLNNGDLTLLGNYNGTTGDLLRLHQDLSTEPLAQGVPTRAASDDAFLANFDGTQGELHLLDRSDGSSRVIGSSVARGSFKFAQQFNGVMMLTNRDQSSNTSTLQVHMIDTDNDYVLHTGVTEAREVAFPSPGLLYNVTTGDDAGVWFSKTL
jgi:hypothetical protein